MRTLIIGLIAIGAFMFASYTAFGQEAPVNPALDQITNDEFSVSVLDIVVTETGEVEERVFFYQGPITQNSSVYIEKAIEMYPDVKKIALNSPGGVAAEAAELGAIFSEHEIQTWIPKGRFCLSACANAFIGGWNYDIQGILGFHAAWLPEESIATLTPKQVNALFGHGQYNGVQDSYYWIVNGFSIQLPAVINSLSSPEKFVVFRSTEELMEYYVRNDDDKEAEKVDQLIRYLTWKVTTEPTVWSGTEMSPYLLEQISDLQENGTRSGKIVEVIYQPAQEEETN